MSETINQEAKSWIDGVNAGSPLSGSWRLEVLEKRARLDDEGRPVEGKEVPFRIRRFVKGIPWALVHDAIRYLISISPYTDIIYNGVTLSGSYRPTITRWRRDEQEQVVPNATGSYTLVQDLVEITGDGDDFDAISADSCSETEETKWVWDAPSIEELPRDGGQGVTYAIRSVRRNEDGTYEYALVKQTAKTQYSDETVTECDEYSSVRTRIWDNVYGGEAGAPFHSDSSDEPLDIPEPCDDREQGVLITRQISQNPDCTFKIVVQVKTAKPNVRSEDEVRKTLRGIVETTIERNRLAPDPTTGLRIGEAVRVELQPDGTYTVTHSQTSPTNVGRIAGECEQTIFEHKHAVTENTSSDPGDRDVPAAAGGVSYRRTHRTTEEGTYDVVDEVIREILARDATVVRRKTLRGVTVTTTDRNTTNGDASVLNLGDEVRVEKTPGGLYNRTKTEVEPTSVGKIATGCESTIFEHRHSTTSNLASPPAEEAPAPGGGTSYQREIRATEEGTYDVVDRVIEEVLANDAQVVKRKTLRGIVSSITVRNTSDGSVPVVNVGDEARVEKTPGGLYNRTITSLDRTPVGEIIKSCAASMLAHTDSVTRNVVEAEDPAHQIPQVNVEFRKTVRMTEEGSYDVQEDTTVHNPVVALATMGDDGAEVELEIGRNCPTVPDPGVGGGLRSTRVSFTENEHGSFDYQKQTTIKRTLTGTATSTSATEVAVTTVTANDPNRTASGDEASVSIGEDGLARTSTTTITPIPVTYSTTWESEVTTPRQKLKYNCGLIIFLNVGNIPPGVRGDASVSVRVNRYGLLDGSISWKELVAWEDLGSSGSGASTSPFSYIETCWANGRKWKRTVSGHTYSGYTPSATQIGNGRIIHSGAITQVVDEVTEWGLV